MSKNWYDRYLAIFGKAIELYGLCLCASLPSDHYPIKCFPAAHLLQVIASKYCRKAGWLRHLRTYRCYKPVDGLIHILAHVPRVGGYLE